jgi:selT/selW/selH-like putative selenoprotein
LAEEIKGRFEVDATLIPGGNGIMDITVDGDMIFSKYKQGRFPEPGELIRLINKKI